MTSYRWKSLWRALVPVLMLGALLSSSLAYADDTSDFFLAVSRDDGYSLKKMIERGVDPNLKFRERGDSGLILALREHSMKAFEALMQAPKVDLEINSENGDTALMIASFTGNKHAVEELLDKGAEANKHGWAALHYAAAIGDCDIIKLLLDHAAYIDAESTNKTPPLMMAARGGQEDAVKLLIEEGADISLKNEAGLTAEDFAVKNDHPDVANLLKPKNSGNAE